MWGRMTTEGAGRMMGGRMMEEGDGRMTKEGAGRMMGAE